MAFGVATVLTNKGAALFADRARTSPGTYTTAPKWIAVGTGATGAARTAVVGDTALTTEVETRAVGTESTVTTTVTGDTYQSQGTVSITGTRALDESGLFDQLAAGGNMATSATYNVINLLSGDSIQLTWKVKIAAG
jgi:hypothetical protein